MKSLSRGHVNFANSNLISLKMFKYYDVIRLHFMLTIPSLVSKIKERTLLMYRQLCFRQTLKLLSQYEYLTIMSFSS